MMGLCENEELFRLALAAAQLGTWDYDPATGHVSCSERTESILGEKPPAETLDQVLRDRTHPADAPQVDAAVRRALEPDSDGAIAIECRMRRPDGSMHWVQINGQAVFAGEGAHRRAVRMVGTTKDITQRKQAEEALAAAKTVAEQASRQGPFPGRAQPRIAHAFDARSDGAIDAPGHSGPRSGGPRDPGDGPPQRGDGGPLDRRPLGRDANRPRED